ncbi:Uncharacterised protein [Mycobacteroides abscessus subsp. abscessus]|nr:Uncharacterised protein [Mycobacteroides abscessus subsp. abscessus]
MEISDTAMNTTPGIFSGLDSTVMTVPNTFSRLMTQDWIHPANGSVFSLVSTSSTATRM